MCNTNKRVCPCKGCTKRTSDCHGRCKKYADWVKDREAERAQQRQIQDNENKWYEIEKERCRKLRQPRRKRHER